MRKFTANLLISNIKYDTNTISLSGEITWIPLNNRIKRTSWNRNNEIVIYDPLFTFCDLCLKQRTKKRNSREEKDHDHNCDTCNRNSDCTSSATLVFSSIPFRWNAWNGFRHSSHHISVAMKIISLLIKHNNESEFSFNTKMLGKWKITKFIHILFIIIISRILIKYLMPLF